LLQRPKFQCEEVSAFRQGGMSVDTEADAGIATRAEPTQCSLVEIKRPIGRGNASGLIEITLHYENRGVVVETNSLTEIFGTLKDIVHQLRR